MTDQPIDNIVPLQREQPQWMSDSFVNFLAGLGVAGRDKFASQNYVHTPLTVAELEAAYRSDWVAKKIVTIPAWDMTREWRHWEADPDQIELLEEVEKKLFVQQKLQQAMIKARLYGGAVIVIGVDAGAPEDELDPEMVTQDSLKFLHVVSRHNIRAGPIIRDISSKYFGEPEYYEARQEPASQGFQQTIETVTPQYAQRQVKLHPSRVVRLIGLDTADQMLMEIWGDSVLQPVNDAVKMCGLVTGSLATLVAELKVDVIKIPELKSIMSTAAGERKMIARFMAANSAKSVINTIMIDGNEEWERIQANLTGVPETMMAYMQIAAGAADIPATRFLGMSPAGLNATGESDIRNYYDRLAAEQTTILTPTLNVLDEVLIRSALGDRPPEVWYDWNSLWQLNATEKAAIALQKAQAYQIDVNAAQLPPVALANARANQLMEDGVYPGLEKALEDAALEGDTIESENAAPVMDPVMEAQKTLAEEGMVQPPGQPGGPPMSPMGGNVIPMPPRKPFGGDAAPDDDEDLDDFNQCHNQSGEEGGEFCGEGSGGESGAGKVGGKGGGSPKPAKSDVHREAKSALERGKKAIGEGLKKLFGKGDPVKGNKGTPAAKKSEGTPAKAAKKDPAKPQKAAKTAKAPKAAKPDRGKAKSERKAAAAQKKLASAAKKSERETAKGAKKAERAAAKGQKAEARAAKKTAGQEKRAAKKEAAGAKKAERQSKAAAKKEASAAKKSERQQAAAAKKEANAAKAAAKKEAAAAKKAAAQKAKQEKRPKSKEPKGKEPKAQKGPAFKSQQKGGKEGGGGKGGDKGKGEPNAPKAKASKPSEPKAAKGPTKEPAAKREPAARKEQSRPQPKPEQKPGMTAKEYREALEKWREEERDRLRRSLGLDSLVLHYGDADDPQLCDQCGGYHLCSACGGALFDHNQCHGPDGKFCSDPSGGPTRSEQRKEKAFERAAKSAFGGGEGKSWDFPREEKPKGKYESLGEAGERAKRNSERERKALRNEAERRIENVIKQMQKEASVKPEDVVKALAEAAVGLGKAGKWAYGKLRKSKAAAPKALPPPVKRGRGRPRTRPIGPKRPRGRPRKH